MRPSHRDTIVAVATAQGEGAIGIVRLSGPRAIDIASRNYRGKRNLNQIEDRRLTYGRFVIGDQDLDQVLVSVMRGPRTYTGEDLVEINCHGGPLLLRRAVQALIEAGARQAQGGEFTRRAFLNGRIDLTQAEAVADLISARADLGLQSAYFQLRGGLKTRFEEMAEALLQALTLLEAGLDFAGDVEIDPRSVFPFLDRAAEEIDRLIASYQRGKMVREGALITLAGRPNVGKSSLLNRLLEEDRAIVTPIPGTTRDTIEESVDLEGIRARLVDTAGIRDAGGPVEQEGARRSQHAIDKSDLVVLVVDGSVSPQAYDLTLMRSLRERPSLLAVNKLDMGCTPDWTNFCQGWRPLPISALTGEGIDALRDAVRSALLGTSFPHMDSGLLTHERHLVALKQAGDALTRTRETLLSGLPGELVAVELREVLDALGEVIGETTPDDILDRIFQTFCIGK